MSENYSLSKDLSEAVKMAEGLESYVQGDQLYKAIGGMFGGADMPALTIGALLMRLRRVWALRDALAEDQIVPLNQATALHDTVQREWRVHYERKLLQEAHSRLDTMRAFFIDCADDPRLCANVYKPEALRRTIVQEILLKMSEAQIVSAELDNKARSTDTKLRAIVRKSEFIWSEILQPVYPEPEFWWLYHSPPYPEA